MNRIYTFDFMVLPRQIVLKFLEGRKENRVWYNGSYYALVVRAFIYFQIPSTYVIALENFHWVQNVNFFSIPM